MAAIMKHRARKFLATGKITMTGHSPMGIGGLDGHNWLYFAIGEHTVYIKSDEWLKLQADINKYNFPKEVVVV